MEKKQLPNSTLVLVMGILSILGCCCYYIPGIIFGIIALVTAKKATEIYEENPDAYTGYGNVTAGKTMAYIGITLSIIMGAVALYLISTGQYTEMMEQYMEQIQQMQGA